MIEGVLWLFIANLAVIAAAHALLARVRTGRGELDALLFLLIRLALIDGTIIVAGLGGFLTARWLGLIGLTTLAVLWATKQREAIPRLSLPRFGWLAGIVSGVVVVRLLLQVWFFAPYTTDVLTYHLPKLAEWVRNGAFTHQLGVDSHAAFPGGHELLQMWWVVFLHHDVLIEMAGVEMLLLAGAAVYALARWLDLSPRWAFLAAFVFVMTPGMQLEATSCLNDDATTALILATFALVLYRAPLGLVAMVIGLGAGVKGSYLYAMPGVVALWWLERREHARLLAATPKKKSASAATPVSSLPTILGGFGLAVGGYWYLRNWVWFGSPVYPMGSKGLVESTGHRAVSFGPDLEGFKNNLLDLIDKDILDHLRPYSGLSTEVSGWGAAAFACGLIALLIALRSDSKFRRLGLGFLAAFLSMLLLIINAPWFSRFFLFIPALLALAIAYLTRKNRWVLLVLVPALLLEFGGTMVPDELVLDSMKPRQEWTSSDQPPHTLRLMKMLMDQSWRERSPARYYGATYEGDAMGYYAEDHGESYFLYKPDFSGRVAYLRSMTPDGLVAEMKEAGVKSLYAVPGTMARVEVLRRAVNDGLLRRIDRRFYTLP